MLLHLCQILRSNEWSRTYTDYRLIPTQRSGPHKASVLTLAICILQRLHISYWHKQYRWTTEYISEVDLFIPHSRAGPHRPNFDQHPLPMSDVATGLRHLTRESCKLDRKRFADSKNFWTLLAAAPVGSEHTELAKTEYTRKCMKYILKFINQLNKLLVLSVVKIWKT